jgi:hypothetical protein
MSADVLTSLRGRVSRDATPLHLDLGALELGGDPVSRDRVVDLVALGITWAAWRQGPVEDWHVAGRIGQVDMMRANAATTRVIRGVLADWLPQRWWTAKGRAPRCIKLPNGEIRIRRSDLDRWLDTCEEAA